MSADIRVGLYSLLRLGAVLKLENVWSEQDRADAAEELQAAQQIYMAAQFGSSQELSDALYRYKLAVDQMKYMNEMDWFVSIPGYQLKVSCTPSFRDDGTTYLLMSGSRLAADLEPLFASIGVTDYEIN